MKKPKITKLVLSVSTKKRNTQPTGVTITIPIPDHKAAVEWSEAIGRKLLQFREEVERTLAPAPAPAVETSEPAAQPQA